MNKDSLSGILLVNKESKKPSFSIVKQLRKITQISKIGFSGTLDPLAEGLMIMLIGKDYTRRSDEFTSLEKTYIADICLGIETNTYDLEGTITKKSDVIPSLEEVQEVIKKFQGAQEQIPPMFSAKKVQGQKLYHLARKGLEVVRKPQKVFLDITFLEYVYPHLKLNVRCSSGTYIRSLAFDIGNVLKTGGYLHFLIRKQIGNFHLDNAIEQKLIMDKLFSLQDHLIMI